MALQPVPPKGGAPTPVWYTIRLISLGLMLLVKPIEGGVGLYMGPYFADPEPRNMTVHQGSIAYLPCMVRQLGDKSVSWVRQRDADILTVNRYTFVRDQRFNVYNSPESNSFTLVIKSVQERDGGGYECQISTEPKMSLVVNLHVIVPQVEFLGEKEKYVRIGSTVRMECRVTSAVQLPDYIFWYHQGSRLLEYDSKRLTIKASRSESENKKTMSLFSILEIKNVQKTDAGNYTCLPSNLESASALLHVLNGEHPAAMQTGSAVTTAPPWTLHLIFMTMLLSLMFPLSLSLGAGISPLQGVGNTSPSPLENRKHSEISSFPKLRIERKEIAHFHFGDSSWGSQLDSSSSSQLDSSLSSQSDSRSNGNHMTFLINR